jgi:hypothetical protein
MSKEDERDEAYLKRLNESLNDPESQAKANQRRENLEHLLNSPMRWYHKVPYWIVFAIIAYGIGKLIGLL